MTKEQKQTAYITFSLLVMPLVAAVFVLGVFMVFELDRFNADGQVFETQSADLDFLYHDGINAFETARYEVAEARFRDALNLYPESAILHNKLGQTLFEQDRPLEAVGAYKRAIALDPDLVDAHYNLGAAYQMVQRYDEAEHAYRAALNIDETYGLAHVGLGELYLDVSGSSDCLVEQNQLC